MKIGIITNFLDEQAGGIATYTYNLINNLNRIDKKNEYFLIHHTNTNLDIYKKNKEIISSFLNTPLFKLTSWRFIKLPLFLKKNNAFALDIIHDTYEIGPLSLVNLPTKKIITVYDLSAYLFPQYHNFLNYLLHKLLFRKTLLNANYVLTISKNSKKDLVKHFNINPNKIKVTYLGVNEKFKLYKNKTELDDVRRKYNLPKKFILNVSTLEPRKNIPNLLKAYGKLYEKIKIPLIIIGKTGWKYKKIFKAIENCNLKDKIILLGYIRQKDLPAIYNLATVFVYPSFYEGFGLPVLEAMACGCPVITSNTSSLPEVAGKAAVMTNPYDVNTLSKTMRKVLTDENLRKSMIKRGLKQVKKFSWNRCAKQTLKAYNKIYNERSYKRQV